MPPTISVIIYFFKCCLLEFLYPGHLLRTCYLQISLFISLIKNLMQLIIFFVKYVPIISQFDMVLSICRDYARHRWREHARKYLFYFWQNRICQSFAYILCPGFSMATWKSNQVWYEYRRRSRIEANHVSHMCGQGWDRMTD